MNNDNSLNVVAGFDDGGLLYFFDHSFSEIDFAIDLQDEFNVKITIYDSSEMKFQSFLKSTDDIVSIETLDNHGHMISSLKTRSEIENILDNISVHTPSGMFTYERPKLANRL